MKNFQKLVLSKAKCIGCRACASRCPAAMIALTDEDGVRTIRFPVTCSEDCTRCAEVCSENAIVLQAVSKPVEAFFSVEFPLVNCADCGKPFTTIPMIEKVRISLTAGLKPVSPFWLDSCFDCRQVTTAVGQVGKKKAVASIYS